MGKRPTADMHQETHADGNDPPSKTDLLLEKIVTLLDIQQKTPELEAKDISLDFEFPAFTLAENPYFSCIEPNPLAAKAFHTSMSTRLMQGQPLTTREAIDFAVLSIYTAQSKQNQYSDDFRNGFLFAMHLYGIVSASLIGNKQITNTLTENKDSLEAWQLARKAALQASAMYTRQNNQNYGYSHTQKRSTQIQKTPSPKKSRTFKKPSDS